MNKAYKPATSIIKRLMILVLTGSLFFNVPPCTIFAESNADLVFIYVSPNGTKDGDGSIDNPFNSLNAAKIAVRKLKKANTGVPITVYLRGGMYNDASVIFDSEDSGEKNAPIIYSAYKDEIPVFSGGVTINTSDFKQVSKKDYDKLPEQSRDYVGVVDLKKKGINRITKYVGKGLQNFKVLKGMDNVYTSFYFNDNEQNLTQWPNGKNEWAAAESCEPNSDGFTTDCGDRMYNWVNAKNAVIAAIFRVDWAYNTVPVKKIMPNSSKIMFDGPVNTGTTTQSIAEGGKWIITNLLEELDVPGEYYIDSDDLKLYFYPPYSTVGVDMQIAYGENVFFTLNSAEYISFNGITFERNRNTAVEINNSNNIDINSCNFKDISLNGVKLRECKDVAIDGCNFTNIGSVGVNINPIDADSNSTIIFDDLTPQNNVVNNCDFYGIATKDFNYSGAVSLNGVANTVSRCRMHDGRSGVVYFNGNDNKIIGNEIYGVLKTVKDMGAIYNGRQITQRGNEFAYNYFHDFDTSSERAGFVSGVYFDDLLGGNNVHHNIFCDIEESASFTGGSDNKFDNNIVISCESAGRFASGGYGSSSFKSSYNNFVQQQVPPVATIDAFKKYDNLNSLYFLNEWPPFGLSIKSNLFYNNKTRPQLSEGSRLFASEDDNIISYDTKYNDIFVSPDEGNYTIKPDAQLESGYEGLKDITMDKIGLYQSDNRRETSIDLSNFRQYYPYNYTSGADGGALYFQWENSLGADYYNIQIALDSDFENIAYESDVQFNYAVVKDIENSDDTYYWRVYAISDGYGCKQKLLSNEKYLVFKTMANTSVDLSVLESETASCDEFISNITEGSESGQFAYGSKAELTQINESAKELLTQKRVSQFVIDEMVLTLRKAKEDTAKTMPRVYKSIDEYLSGNWSSQNPKLSSSISGNMLTVSNADDVNMAVVGCDNKTAPKDALLSFEMECDTDSITNGWKGIALCDEKSVGSLIWSGGKKGYLIVIKHDQLEFQVWNGTSNNILATADNPFVNGTMNKVNFGILSFGTGQRVILEVNGSTIFDVVNTDSIVKDDLYFSLYDTKFFKNAVNSGVKIASCEVPESVISYVATQPQYFESDNIESVLKSADRNSELSAANKSIISKDVLDGTKTIRIAVKPDLSRNLQGIIFSNNDLEKSQYRLSFTDGRVSLEKYVNDIKTTISGINTNAVQNQSWNNVEIVRKNHVDTVQITVVINGTKVIDCIDEYPIKQKGGFGIYSLSEQSIVVKAQ